MNIPSTYMYIGYEIGTYFFDVGSNSAKNWNLRKILGHTPHNTQMNSY